MELSTILLLAKFGNLEIIRNVVRSSEGELITEECVLILKSDKK